jgi:hypothetical protein
VAVQKVRRRIRVILGDQDFEVVTNAFDMVKAERDGQGAVESGFRTVHLACLRQRKPVPVKFETFLEQLRALDELADEDPDGPTELDPTQSEGSESSP